MSETQPQQQIKPRKKHSPSNFRDAECYLPDLNKARQLIESVEDQPVQYALKLLYLTCGRVSEIVSEAYPYETCYGLKTGDFSKTIYEDKRLGFSVPVLVISVPTAKHHGRRRYCAIPLDPKYEPWAEGVLKYAQYRGDNLFCFTRQWLWRKAKPVFKDLEYPITPYTFTTKREIVKIVNGEIRVYPPGTKVSIKDHPHPCALHWIRHLRATELVSAPGYSSYYRFDVSELAAFTGWTIKGLLGLGRSSGAFERYLTTPWESYFPKLLRPRQDGANPVY